MTQIAWVKPEWVDKIRGMDDADILALTDADIAAFDAENKACDVANSKLAKDFSDKIVKLTAEASELLGGAHRVVKAIRKEARQSCPYSYDRTLKNLRDRRAALRERETKKERDNAIDILRQEAVVWLQERGKKLGVDFALGNAIEIADNLAFESEVARLAAMPVLHGFCGDDSCEGCGGWDGKSHRCECGNRRVCWTMGDSHSFKRPCVYAEAY